LQKQAKRGQANQIGVSSMAEVIDAKKTDVRHVQKQAKRGQANQIGVASMAEVIDAKKTDVPHLL
jgi:hypothetical protein